ncbi:MAG TPA: hypothetical protein ENO22_06735 [candidate division Zixibacteria bacterium]|nr:hypothetical protein [candidate division Zixibacteria bacterium]
MNKIISIMILFSICLAANSFASEYILPGQYKKEKNVPVISDRGYSFLAGKADGGKVNVWIYFTDKGVFRDAEFIEKAEVVYNSMSAQSRQRRAKNNASEIRFEDLPVNDQYISQIEGRGLKLRRIVKWLNAASFQTDLEKLEKIKDLPFVLKITPVASFSRPEPPESEELEDLDQVPDQKRDIHLLSYGASYSQLEQINVIAAHDSGFSGDGIIVAMFDTGFRKDHLAFANIISEGRLIAEYDFINNDYETANEEGDVSNQWDHGTKTWSALGGGWDGEIYGPAYGASFILCKTEDMTSETPAEEDNWAAAVVWSDSIGVDIISSSLGYSDWYTYDDLDGNTCVITNAADYAASIGILVCNSAGNGGPAAGTITAPADGDSVIAVGSVEASGYLSYFSSKGPTADGRIKPEVCARGSSTTCASPYTNSYITTASGTSLSCPLVAGSAAIVMEARPDFTVMDVRQALMLTASRALTPDNAYGWGIIDVIGAMSYMYVPDYLQGDANFDGTFNISDAVYIINYAFVDGDSPQPVLEAGDANNDGEVNVSDAVFLINFIFIAGAPAPPGYDPGN